MIVCFMTMVPENHGVPEKGKASETLLISGLTSITYPLIVETPGSPELLVHESASGLDGTPQ